MVFKRTQKRGMSFLKHLFDCKEGKLTLNKLFFLSLLELSAAHAKKAGKFSLLSAFRMPSLRSFTYYLQRMDGCKKIWPSFAKFHLLL